MSTLSTPTAGAAMVNSAALMVDNEAGAADPRYGGPDDDDDIDPEMEAQDPLRAPLLGGFDKGGDIESVQEAEVQQVSGYSANCGEDFFCILTEVKAKAAELGCRWMVLSLELLIERPHGLFSFAFSHAYARSWGGGAAVCGKWASRRLF